MDPAGDFVVVWRSVGSAGDDNSSFSVQGQRFRVTGDVGDKVWHDENFDGLQDVLELGIEGVRVNLYDTGASLVDWTLTDAMGEFLFRKKDAGNYTLEYELPPSYDFTAQDVGADDTVDSDADSTTGQTVEFAIQEAVTDLDWDAGMAEPNGIGNFVWEDVDQDGFQDVGESGLAGVSVNLVDATLAATVAGPVVTGADGLYSFSNQAPGDYYLAFTAPSGYVFTSENQGDNDLVDSDANPVSGVTAVFTLSVGQSDTSWDAGLAAEPLTQVGNRVWLDVDGDGIQDGGEVGVAGVDVAIYQEPDPPFPTRAAALVETTTTDANGFYSFTVDSGTYYLEVACPAAAFTVQSQGNDPELDSDVDPTSQTTVAFTLALGDGDGSRDAGLLNLDADGDGVIACVDCDDNDPLDVCVVFSDGFETGDLSAWSSSDP